MHIRAATKHDRDAVREIYLNAFPENERALVADLACNLLSEEAIPPTLSLIADIDDVISGHVAFSPAAIDKNKQSSAYILAPLAVQPGQQRQGVGTALIEHGIGRLDAMNVNFLFVYGDPDYYGRFVFSAEIAAHFTPPYLLQFPLGWQANILNAGSPDRSSGKITCVPSLSDPALW